MNIEMKGLKYTKLKDGFDKSRQIYFLSAQCECMKNQQIIHQLLLYHNLLWITIDTPSLRKDF